MIEYDKLFSDDDLCGIITWTLNATDKKVIILKDALYYFNKENNVENWEYIKNKEIHQISLNFSIKCKWVVSIFCDAGYQLEIDFSGDFDGKKLAEEVFVEIVSLYNRASK